MDFNALRDVYTKEMLLAEYGDPHCMVDQRASEFRMLLEYYRLLQPKYVVEIGSYEGGTLYYFMKYAAPGAKVISLDIDHSRLSASPVAGVHPHLTITADSQSADTVARIAAMCPVIDFLFIDGCHNTDAVRSDVRRYGAFANVIAMHDINARTEPQDVRAVWLELVRSPEWQTVEWIEIPTQQITRRGSYGIGLAVRRRPNWLSLDPDGRIIDPTNF